MEPAYAILPRKSMQGMIHKYTSHLVPSAVSLGGDDIVQSLQSSSTLTNSNELVSALERILGLLEDSSAVVPGAHPRLLSVVHVCYTD